MTALLRFHVKHLRLRPAAPWPSEGATTRAIIQAWRREQRLRLAANSVTNYATKAGKPAPAQ